MKRAAMNDLWEPIGSGLAFFAAILGWVWHAARLASKIDQMKDQLDKHVEDEASVWNENRRSHDKLNERISELREDLAGILWKNRHRSHQREEE